MITHGHRAWATIACRLAQRRLCCSSACANGMSSTSTRRGGCLSVDLGFALLSAGVGFTEVAPGVDAEVDVAIKLEPELGTRGNVGRWVARLRKFSKASSLDSYGTPEFPR